MISPSTLIALVKQFPSIWDQSATVYRDITVVANDWEKIAQETKLPGILIIKFN